MTVSGGPSTTYGYYPDGSVRTIDWSPAGVFKYDYRRTGQYETVEFPNGQTRNYTYDEQGRLLQLANLHPTAGNLARTRTPTTSITPQPRTTVLASV